MEIFLYIVFGAVGLFLLVFLVGFLYAALTNKKRFQGNAASLFGQLSDHEKSVVSEIWTLFKKTDRENIEVVPSELNQLEIKHIMRLFDPDNRRIDLSAGKLFDNTAWFSWFNQAREKGFNDVEAAIIAGVGLHGIDEFL